MKFSKQLNESDIVSDIEFLKQEHGNVDKSDFDSICTILKHRLEKYNEDNPNGGGVGLAAPQIGISLRACYIKNSPFELFLCNPVITDSYGIAGIKEGCLSVRGKKVFVNRSETIHVVDDLHPAGLIITGINAIIVQHEIDHLNGLLITDHLQEPSSSSKIPRNDPCPCGSGKKYKKCCNER